MAPILILTVHPVRGHFIALPVKHHRNRAVLDPRIDRPAENGLYFLWLRRGGDITVLRLFTQQAVADAPAHDIRLKSVLIQFFNDLLRVRRNPHFYPHAIISFLY